MGILQVALAAVLGALIALTFKSGKIEYGIYISIAVSLFLFGSIISRLEVFVDTVRQIQSYIRVDTSYLSSMLKMIGVSYLAEFCSGICRDAGYQTLAVQVETFSKLTILALGMPVLLALLQTIQVFLA